ncbi:MAG: bifunctional 2-polyprenyl-6-hydroxyphenol methylase/3-demethylubiquinol 3-O-methyltransferase UbiG [Xanthomonadales bacterium]|nr:bifunctional 2-polyprenyl-6-hydroxyphenol methylase/3-demethylubiquinol 3-O-methyltransferase UbiG [Xanthomonadales bacterium]NIN60681.1 bifunctional 2-polyprenyl-6-hydroxyphenol methylase/3-demethylubiquinol 3-O-methyltransferase UbiG [Xanthomonadales bacterium]NIN76043.1 bifunctional 2-polyprenyl-6-hydroxyphenol methylase/3-demethylubiquinol 3-O-methyltransferase UbiG [Xanthomonadales bacterium]NIO14351.1 bifunctional 2-polyprenyl-6-hydroxyphenol methylase/3-demethylubiquinol 3-O-methyltran
MAGKPDINIDPVERERFDAIAAGWWDPQGDSRPLHDLNPARLRYIAERAELAGADVLDVGCGGGILAESLAARGARVIGIDVASRALDVARLHLLESGLQVDYHSATAEEYATAHAARFDVVACMELLEHVPEPRSVVAACARLLKPGGHCFMSTLNRTPAAFALAIVGAEHVAGILPRGTHRYDRFIRPSELSAWLRAAGMQVMDIRGLHYNPLTRTARLGGPVMVNYLVHAQRSGRSP